MDISELNKTIKLKKTENIFVSVRAPGRVKNKTTKNYLNPTASSMNKSCQKFINRPSSSSSNRTNFSNTTPLSSRKEKINTTNQPRQLSRTLNSNIYYDNLDHFGDNNNLNYDPYGHFS